MTVPSDLIPGVATIIPRSGAEPPRVVTFLPYAFPPADAVHIDVVDVTTIAAGGNVLIGIVNTGTANAVFRWFGNESTVAAGYADLLWTILINGIPKQPYNLMQESRGLINDPDPVLILVGQGQLVEIRVDNTGVANLEAKTRLKGWIF